MNKSITKSESGTSKEEKGSERDSKVDMRFSDKPGPGLLRIADFGNGKEWYATEEEIAFLRSLMEELL
jgi:hypothetical protein